MSVVTSKSSAKKGFTAPVLKETTRTLDNSDEKKEHKKTKKEKNTNVQKLTLEINNERKDLKKSKKNKENIPEYNKEEKSTTKNFVNKKPQVSLTDSQYEDIFNAVLGTCRGSYSQQHTPLDEFSDISEKIQVHTPSSKKGGICKADSQPVAEPVTPSTTMKRNTPQETPKTPTRSTPTQQKPPVSPWGTHFSKHSSQASVILKEFHESQSSLLNSSALLSPDTSNSDGEAEELSQRSVCQLSQVSGYGSQSTYFKLQATDQRARLEELQNLRNVGVWVFCCRSSCQKQRYLADVTDPQEIPDVWYCHMNPDSQFNSCMKPEQKLSAEEEDDMIYNEYTAGSVVWARVAGFPWWPAMVDDDPDLEQYYWLDNDFKTVTYYHVVFFDEGSVTRAWVNLKNIDSYVKNENKYKQRMSRGIDFGRRIMVAKEQATDALTLSSCQRLKIYSFIARYKGPINTSKSQVNKTIKNYKLKGKGRKPSAKEEAAEIDKKEIGEHWSTKGTKPTKEKRKSQKRKLKIDDLEKPPTKKHKCKENDNTNNLCVQTKCCKNSEISNSKMSKGKKKMPKPKADDVCHTQKTNHQHILTIESKMKLGCTTSDAEVICERTDGNRKMDISDNRITSNIIPETEDNIENLNSQNDIDTVGDQLVLSSNEIKCDKHVNDLLDSSQTMLEDLSENKILYNQNSDNLCERLTLKDKIEENGINNKDSKSEEIIDPKTSVVPTSNESGRKDEIPNNKILDAVKEKNQYVTSQIVCNETGHENLKSNTISDECVTNDNTPQTEGNVEQVDIGNRSNQWVCSTEKIKSGKYLNCSLDDSETLLENLSKKTKLLNLAKINIRDPRNNINISSELNQEEHKENIPQRASISYGKTVLDENLIYPDMEENLSQRSSKCRQQLNANYVETNQGNPTDYEDHRLSQNTIADFFAESEDAIVPDTNLSQNSLPFEE